MRSLFLLLLVSLAVPTAWAQQPYAPVKKVVEEWLQIQNKGLPGQVSVEISPLDPGNQLVPCKAFDISRPPGSKAWGRTNVVVRCLDEANWRVYLSVHVRVKAPYLISARPIAQGQVVIEEDLTSQTGDLSELPANILIEPERAIGKVASTSIPAGRPLRADMVKAQMVIRQGQTVRALSRGPGFAVANEGRALNNAVEGQLVQVRLGSGQVVSGMAKANGVVEISY
jgi:flagella basal body P-ring formation protein FlgA